MENLIERLNKKGYTELSIRIDAANEYYRKDPLVYCEKCRNILGLFLNQLEDILETKVDGSIVNYQKRIEILNNHRSMLIDEELCNELHTMRMLGNKYAHQDQKDVCPDVDRKTFKTAIFKIAERLLELPEQYERFQNKEAARKKEAGKRRKKVGVVVAILLAILGIVGKLLGGRK